MEMAPGLRALAEKITNLRDWQAEREAERAAWDEATEGAMRPALVALTASLGEVGRELDAALRASRRWSGWRKRSRRSPMRRMANATSWRSTAR